MDTYLGVSIIVPTFKEAKNIPQLINRIAKIDFENRAMELLIVDDNSQDGIVDVVKKRQPEYPWLRIIERKPPRSLSKSIIDGFYQANYPLLVALDADLSHPPEKIPEMIAALPQPNVDIVLGSRYVQGGSTDEVWPFSRKLASRLAAGLAKLVLFKKIKDPLSGFIAIRKEKFLSGNDFKCMGWKVGLELIVKCQCKNVYEVPIHFSERLYGESKLKPRIILQYFLHLKALLMFSIARKLKSLRGV